MSKYSKYRPEIDGLRALAVLGVVFFHFGLGCSGGFVGVDVFFVISGFLITQIIVREVEGGKFSFIEFWARRIRRILPAVLVVVITTFLVGYFILEPLALSSLGKSGVAYSLLVSNVFFWRANDYFSEAADLQPLLHTWSLSVEEQFYLFYPLVLVFLLRKKRAHVIHILFFLLFVSLVISIWAVPKFPSGAFYLLPTRAWELILGGVLALKGSELKSSNAVKEAVSGLGLLFILWTMFAYDSATTFPGLNAILPTLGAVFFIGANSSGVTLSGKVLSWKPLVYIGLASYSIYLWHWPVLVFVKHLFVDVSTLIIVLSLLVTVLLSFLSWRFIEIPFRNSQRLKAPRQAILFGGIATAVTFLCAFVFLKSGGFPNRFDSNMQAIVKDISWVGREYESVNNLGVPIGSNVKVEASPDFVIMGDSHGMVASSVIDKAAKKRGLKGIAFNSNGRPPITGLWKPFKGPDRKNKTVRLNRERLDWIIENKVKHLILIGRWNAMVNGLLESEANESHGRSTYYSLVTDSASTSVSPESSRAAFIRQFIAMQNELEDNGVTLWVLQQVPVNLRPTTARDFYLKTQFPLINQKSFKFAKVQRKIMKSNEKLFTDMNFESSFFRMIDASEFFFKKERLLELYSNRAHYRDEDHLTQRGCELYLEGAFAQALDEF